MKKIYNDLIKVRNPETGAFEDLPGFAGEAEIAQLREDLQTTTDIAKNGVASAYAAYVMAEEAINRTVELTQAEYDALSDTKLTDNVTYFITDGEDAVSSFVLGGAS